MLRLCVTCGTLAALASCAGSSEGEVGGGLRGNGSPALDTRDDAVAAYERASSLALAGNLAGAYDALELSMRAGYPTPSDVSFSDELRALLEAPAWRPRVFALLKESARESSISMFHPDEPGEPMILTVRIVAGREEPPMAAMPFVAPAGVVVGLVHVDAAGYYQPWEKDQDWNPRHFGFAVTDETGTIVVHTIRPGHYAPEYEAPDEPAHVHYNVEQNGVLLRASELYFQDDPRLEGEARREAEEARVPIASIVRDDDGTWRAEVTIPVRGLR